jgi:ribosome modulation factor
MRLTSLLLAFCAVMLAACSSTATMGQNECSAVDWRTIGYEDGVAGRSGAQIGVHRRACAKYGIAPDLEAYQLGRAEGLREFCQPHNGYRSGVTGAPYHDVCPADLAARFLAHYQAGHELYVHEQRVRYADAQLNVKRAEIARLEDAVARSGLRAIKETSTLEQRAQAMLDARQYAERIGRLKAEVAQFERDRMLYAQELAAYRATVASTN